MSIILKYKWEYNNEFNLNILGKVYAINLPNVSNFLISVNTTCTIGSSSYYK